MCSVTYCRRSRNNFFFFFGCHRGEFSRHIQHVTGIPILDWRWYHRKRFTDEQSLGVSKDLIGSPAKAVTNTSEFNSNVQGLLSA